MDIHSKDNKKITLRNEIKEIRLKEDEPGVNLTLDVKQCALAMGGPSEMKPPPREVSYSVPKDCASTGTDIPTFPVLTTSANAPNLKENPEPLFTRESNPHKPE